MIRYFAAGAKPQANCELGVEVEHFIVDSVTREAVPYEGDRGVRSILTALMDRYENARVLPDDDFFGFAVPEFTITLEPAAQLEISIVPEHDIKEIGAVYRRFSESLRPILSEYGYAVMNVGFQPVSDVEKLTLIPKRRYALMDAHFQKSGTGGREMMRGSASVQVSIDYFSEDDFRRKVQAAYYYGPVLKLLCDNAPFVQGKPAARHLLRTDIWRRVDSNRCGILPGVFSESYGFGDYADFLGRMKPIFLKEGASVRPTGEQTAAELFAEREPAQAEVEHLLSMAFPDVRLKHYLEIRYADSMPLPYLLAYVALIKGLLYHEAGLSYARNQLRSRKLTDADIIRAEDSLMAMGWDGMVYGRNVRDAAEELLALAGQSLPEAEQAYLEAFRAVIRYGGIDAIPREVSEAFGQYTEKGV